MDQKANKKRITELKNQVELLEERFVLKEITTEQFAKFSKKYNEEIHKIEGENNQHGNLSSNLKKAIEKSLKISENIYQMWVSGDFYDKQKLQYLLCPDGMLYDKKRQVVLTTKVNYLFREIAVQAMVSTENKKDNLLQDCLFGGHVGTTRFELATTRPPAWYATGLRYVPKERLRI